MISISYTFCRFMRSQEGGKLPHPIILLLKNSSWCLQHSHLNKHKPFVPSFVCENLVLHELSGPMELSLHIQGSTAMLAFLSTTSSVHK